MLNPVKANSRNVGDKIEVYDLFNHYDRLSYTGTIVNITKKYLTVQHDDLCDRFHRATGYIVGYSFPTFEYGIAGERS